MSASAPDADLAPGSIAALIPAYNAGAAIAGVVARTAAVVGYGHVYVVDDGSSDETSARATAAGAHVFRQEVNKGKGRALARGFAELLARGYAAVVTLDADGQHDPAEIPHLVECARATGADMIIGSRMRDVSGMPWLRVVVNRTMSWFISALAGRRIEDSQSGYRLHRSQLLRSITLVTHRYETETEILIKAGRRGFRFAFCPVRTIYGEEKSGIHPLVDTVRFVRLVVRSCGWW
jgi:glycosyltransferase involved in cell wall biosynthesis